MLFSAKIVPSCSKLQALSIELPATGGASGKSPNQITKTVLSFGHKQCEQHLALLL